MNREATRQQVISKTARKYRGTGRDRHIRTGQEDRPGRLSRPELSRCQHQGSEGRRHQRRREQIAEFRWKFPFRREVTKQKLKLLTKQELDATEPTCRISNHLDNRRRGRRSTPNPIDWHHDLARCHIGMEIKTHATHPTHGSPPESGT